jgi:hypothetical protein
MALFCAQALDGSSDCRGMASAAVSPMLHRIEGDIRFALRQFATHPGFTATVAVVLAVG